MSLSGDLLPLWMLLSARCVSADGGDDFANNLFSDLGPLLALFGERVTMQFMSGAMGWADNVILAMAPLGIITAIVGAIRVGGPSWLKAVIGRARENLAVAEAELMSSTSQEVCELWNGQEIVRCMGSPSVVEFICLLHANSKTDEGAPEIEVEPLRKALNKNDADKHLEPIDLTIKGDFRRWRDSRRSPDSSNADADGDAGCALAVASHTHAPGKIVVKRNCSRDAPNISLNTHRQTGRGELRAVAAIGTILQSGVLLYSGFATYYPTLKFPKDNSAIASYAYSCTAAGTLVVVVGMMLCAHVVESSTKEDRFQARPGTDTRIRMVWLQQTKTVSDQVFGSFAIYSKDDQAFITTSRRSQKDEAMTDGSDPPDLTSRPSDSTAKLTSALRSLEIKTVLGTMTTLTGFVLQFVGLRGLHWSASIAQLGAVFLMVCLKAWVRRGLATPPEAISLPPGYELDWFARTLGKVNEAPWNGKTKPRERLLSRFGQRLEKLPLKLGTSFGVITPGTKPAAKGSEKEVASAWRIASSGDTHFGHEKRCENQCEKQKESHSENEGEYQGEEPCLNNAKAAVPSGIADAQTVLRIRNDLGHLAKWQGPASTEAVSLARAIEIVMDALIGPSPIASASSSTFYWSLDAIYDGKDHDPINFEIWRQHDGRWKAFANEYDAALSLWLSSANDEKERAVRLSENEKEREVRSTGNANETTVKLGEDEKSPDHIRNKKEDSRLRMEESQGGQGLRLLGLNTPALRRDLQWWVPKDLIHFLDVRQDNDGDFRVENQRIIGYEQQNWNKEQKGSHRENQPEHLTCFTRTELRNQTPDADEDESTEDDDEATDNDDEGTIEDDDDETTEDEDEPIKHEDEPIKHEDKSNEDESDPTKHVRREANLAAESYASLPLLFTQHMFSAFMHAVASTKERDELFQGVAKTIPNASESSTWKSFTLHNATLSTMIREIESTSLGSLEDIYACVIPPLSQKQKLPRADDAIIQLVREQAKQHERLQHWTEATEIYLWLFRKANTFGTTHEIVAKATALLMEYLKLVSATIDLRKGDETETMSTLEGAEKKVEKALKKSGDCQILSKLMMLYAEQDRAWKCAVVDGENTQLDQEERDRYPKAFNFTILHERAKRNSTYGINQAANENKGLVNAKDILHWTPLHYAARTWSTWACACLLKQGADIESPDLMGWTPLHYLCQISWNFKGEDKNEEQTFYELIREGADVNAQGRDGMTPLHCASIKGNDWAVRALIGAGANTDIPDASGNTPLLWAVSKGQLDVTQTLWGFSNERLRDNNGRTALHLSVLPEKTSVAQWVITKGVDLEARDRRGCTPLHLAASNGHEDMAALLIENDAEVNAKDIKGATPIYIAASHGHEKLIALLIERRGAPDATNRYGWRPLHEAADKGHEKAVEMLIEHGEENGSEEWTPLARAVSQGHEKVVALFIQKGVDIRVNGESSKTLLHLAAEWGHTRVIKLLIQKGADKDAKDEGGATPLHKAVEGGHEKAVKLLLKKGVDLEARGTRLGLPLGDRLTPLHLAAMYGRLSISRILMAKGAKTDALDGAEPSRLSLAIKYRRLEVAKHFIHSRSSKVDERLSDGGTLLHRAITDGDEDAVKFLIDNGLDQQIEDKQGRTARQRALEMRKEASEGREPEVFRPRIGWTKFTVKEIDDIISLLKS